MKRIFSALALLARSGPAFAGSVNVENVIAIKGYDPVASFIDNKPIKGGPAYKADIDSAAFTIAGGTLYPNYNAKVQATWKQDIPGYIREAEVAWPMVSQQMDVVHGPLIGSHPMEPFHVDS